MGDIGDIADIGGIEAVQFVPSKSRYFHNTVALETSRFVRIIEVKIP